MKKVLSIVLAIAMIATMSAVAFAAAGDKEVTLANDAAANIDVNAIYVSGTKTDNYKVDIKWKDLAFTYTSSGEIWDVENHKYVATVAGTWTVGEIAEAITVTNHSSQGVTSTAAYNKVVDTVEGTIDTAVKNLGIGGAADASVSYDLSVTGTIAQDFDGKVGTVTITIGGIPEDYTPVAVPQA